MYLHQYWTSFLITFLLALWSAGWRHELTSACAQKSIGRSLCLCVYLKLLLVCLLKPPHQPSLARGAKRLRAEGKGDKREKRLLFFPPPPPPVTSVSSLSPPLLTSHSPHHLPCISLHLSAQPGRLGVFAPSHIHLQLQPSTLVSTHTPALPFSPSFSF